MCGSVFSCYSSFDSILFASQNSRRISEELMRIYCELNQTKMCAVEFIRCTSKVQRGEMGRERVEDKE